MCITEINRILLPKLCRGVTLLIDLQNALTLLQKLDMTMLVAIFFNYPRATLRVGLSQTFSSIDIERKVRWSVRL